MASWVENHSFFPWGFTKGFGILLYPRAPIKSPDFPVLGRLWQISLTCRVLLLKSLWTGMFMECCPELAKNGIILLLIILPTFRKQQCVLGTKAQAKEVKARVKQHWVESGLSSVTRGSLFSFMNLTYLEMGTIKLPLWVVIRINQELQPTHRCS